MGVRGGGLWGFVGVRGGGGLWGFVGVRGGGGLWGFVGVRGGGLWGFVGVRGGGLWGFVGVRGGGVRGGGLWGFVGVRGGSWRWFAAQTPKHQNIPQNNKNKQANILHTTLQKFESSNTSTTTPKTTTIPKITSQKYPDNFLKHPNTFLPPNTPPIPSNAPQRLPNTGYFVLIHVGVATLHGDTALEGGVELSGLLPVGRILRDVFHRQLCGRLRGLLRFLKVFLCWGFGRILI